MSYGHHKQASGARAFGIQPRVVITWRTGKGEYIPINELPDEHLQNILAYVNKKGADWQAIRDEALKARGVNLGEYIINARYASEWIDIFFTEIKYRQDNGISIPRLD